MFGLSAAIRVYLASQPADMRKSFDGLAALASGLALDPLSGHLFVFVNKRRTRLKVRSGCANQPIPEILAPKLIWRFYISRGSGCPPTSRKPSSGFRRLRRLAIYRP